MSGIWMVRQVKVKQSKVAVKIYYELDNNEFFSMGLYSPLEDLSEMQY